MIIIQTERVQREGNSRKRERDRQTDYREQEKGRGKERRG